jgi:hypothetical protein
MVKSFSFGKRIISLINTSPTAFAVLTSTFHPAKNLLFLSTIVAIHHLRQAQLL